MPKMSTTGHRLHIGCPAPCTAMTSGTCSRRTTTGASLRKAVSTTRSSEDRLKRNAAWSGCGPTLSKPEIQRPTMAESIRQYGTLTTTGPTPSRPASTSTSTGGSGWCGTRFRPITTSGCGGPFSTVCTTSSVTFCTTGMWREDNGDRK
uniref:(northern house mosquito) hypothetical protein n=1 Tax=Culex pipiens TaxID=7175 RepID=A0A8D8H9Q8_CULPI